MDVYDLDLDGPHGFAGFRMGWLILTRISCKCGWKGQARWPSGAGLDLCADELIAHQMRNRPHTECGNRKPHRAHTYNGGEHCPGEGALAGGCCAHPGLVTA